MSASHACTDPHHHVDSADAFVRVVERACNERGLRLTPIRANVLRLIADAGKPVKAYELLEQVREGKGAGADAAAAIAQAREQRRALRIVEFPNHRIFSRW